MDVKGPLRNHQCQSTDFFKSVSIVMSIIYVPGGGERGGAKQEQHHYHKLERESEREREGGGRGRERDSAECSPCSVVMSGS